MSAPSPFARPGIFWLCVVAIMLAGFAVRMREADQVARPGALHFTDNDTVRRLARLRAIDEAAEYPVRELHDGAPDGTVIHWTLPMDWCIRALDPIASVFHPVVEPYEAGAALSGPLLAVASILVLALGVRSLLGPGASLLAAALYALAYSTVNVSLYGNGDHQNLQHLSLVGSLALLFGCLQRPVRQLTAACSGALLGLAIWISTESQLVFLVSAALLGILAVATPRAVVTWLRTWVAGASVVAFVGMVFEHPTLGAFCWDQVSWFQLWPMAVFALFAAALPFTHHHGPGGIVATGVVALAIGATPFALAGVREAFAGQLDNFETVNTWLQVQVSEYRTAFRHGDGASIAPILDRFSYLVLALPVLLVGIRWHPTLSAAARAALIAFVGAFFALALWEVKLGHLFAIVWAPCIVAGARGWATRRPLAARTVAAFAIVTLVCGALSLPPGRDDQRRRVDASLRELCEVVADQVARRPGTVLAPWDFGGHLMYLADAPVVATGYHRNLAGIHDQLRAYASQPSDLEELREILRRREVRHVVLWSDRFWMTEAHLVLDTVPPLAHVVDGALRLTEFGTGSLYGRLRYATVPGFTEVARSRTLINTGVGNEPIFRVFAVDP